MTKVFFILASTLFFLFVVYISSQLGIELITGFNPSLTEFVSSGNWLVDMVNLVGWNLSIFVNLMFISSEFALFNGVILLGYGISLLWSIMELARGV